MAPINGVELSTALIGVVVLVVMVLVAVVVVPVVLKLVCVPLVAVVVLVAVLLVPVVLTLVAVRLIVVAFKRPGARVNLPIAMACYEITCPASSIPIRFWAIVSVHACHRSSGIS